MSMIPVSTKLPTFVVLKLPPTIALAQQSRIAVSSPCRVSGGRAVACSALFFAVLLLSLSGCATNSVTTLLKASKQGDAIMPSTAVVQQELKGRAFEVGVVTFDLRKAGDKEGPDIPDSAYLELLDSQLRKAFRGATLENGVVPAYPVNVAIEQLKLKPAMFLIPGASEFRVRMDIASAGGEILMRGQFQSFLPGPNFMVIMPGVVAPIFLPAKGWEYVALAKMFPAVAVVITKTAQGLQEGKTLDKIKVYPHDIEAGNIISPDLFLKNAPFGMTQIDYQEIKRAIKTSQAREDR